MDLRLFKQDDLFNATHTFFRDTIGLQLQTKSRMPINLENQFETFGIKSKKVEEVWSHVDKTYYIGLLDDDNFEKEIAEQEKSDLQEDLEDVELSDDEYPGILIFAVDLNDGFNPTRSNLTEINRTLNRFSQRVPALVLARYGNKISLMLADRVAYKQGWREGEKVRKVSLLRDIDLDKTHAGHLRILKDLVVPTTGTKKVENFDGLYEYWKEVLDTSELNKKFYQDLSNWYFWAIKHVRFPDEPTLEDAHKQDKELDDMLQEHRATNVIRLLTRLLFVWFIKEKGLIPEELFDLKTLQQDILKEITPYHETGMFKEANKESIYYKSILQNLFFATLNCPIEADAGDKRERGFRSTKGSSHFGVTYLMRYEEHFKDKEAFLKLVNSKVPFLNGGLFECLDIRGEKEDKEDRVWVDGFSDNLPKEHKLVVPDFLFFGVEEEVDLSEDYGLKSKKYKEAAVRGLLNIFKSYKFTITENTPIEEDVALDPELLGKVFENLLASYNPETKTTARKQTGSFYTPREIVNYMVDESLIAYLKNAIEDWGISEDELDEKLHQLTSYEETVPFEGNEELHREIISALSNCTILDPACGSGAFPMGILQKMVHILQKLDPENEVWKEVQKEKASKEADRAISEIEDKEERQQRLIEINEAFDERMNAPDYARKLFLIENCIYGVDIQPVATQISKLRFFISLVVEQKVGEDKSDNFGIRPLPNLETKFVTANTLIDIKDNSNQTSLYETDKIIKLEAELKQVRSKLFSARTTDTKYKYRQKDEKLRNEIAAELKKTGWPNDSADKLASWDPYDQNASSPFFNPEWMFDIKEGFKIVIGNPPYKQVPKKTYSETRFEYSEEKDPGKQNLYKLFVEVSKEFSQLGSGTFCLIVQSSLLCDLSSMFTRELILKKTDILEVVEFPKKAPTKEGQVFENVLQGTCICIGLNRLPESESYFNISINNDITTLNNLKYEVIEQSSIFELYPDTYYIPLVNLGDFIVMEEANINSTSFSQYILDINQGDINLTSAKDYFTDENTGVKLFRGKNVQRFHIINDVSEYVQRGYKSEVVNHNRENTYLVCQEVTGTTDKYRLHFSLTPESEEYLFGHTANKILLNDDDYLKAINVILNSKYLDWLFRKTSTNNHVMGYEIVQFPIPNNINAYQKILEDVYDIMRYTYENRLTELSILEEVMNSLVLNLYFESHMIELDIDIGSQIESELSVMNRENTFSQYAKPEREKIIKQLHNHWSDPENEVRKRINSFPEKSPDILKPILEG